jgi:hypothetical protein
VETSLDELLSAPVGSNCRRTSRSPRQASFPPSPGTMPADSVIRLTGERGRLREALLAAIIADGMEGTIRNPNHGLTTESGRRVAEVALGAGDAEREVARRFGADVLAVAAAAHAKWGRSLSQERDRRLKRRGDMTADTRRAVRGRITRDLVDELAPMLSKPSRRR